MSTTDVLGCEIETAVLCGDPLKLAVASIAVFADAAGATLDDIVLTAATLCDFVPYSPSELQEAIDGGVKKLVLCKSRDVDPRYWVNHSMNVYKPNEEKIWKVFCNGKPFLCPGARTLSPCEIEKSKSISCVPINARMDSRGC